MAGVVLPSGQLLLGEGTARVGMRCAASRRLQSRSSCPPGLPSGDEGFSRSALPEAALSAQNGSSKFGDHPQVARFRSSSSHLVLGSPDQGGSVWSVEASVALG